MLEDDPRLARDVAEEGPTRARRLGESEPGGQEQPAGEDGEGGPHRFIRPGEPGLRADLLEAHVDLPDFLAIEVEVLSWPALRRPAATQASDSW